jgi:hypothetical protein
LHVVFCSPHFLRALNLPCRMSPTPLQNNPLLHQSLLKHLNSSHLPALRFPLLCPADLPVLGDTCFSCSLIPNYSVAHSSRPVLNLVCIETG